MLEIQVCAVPRPSGGKSGALSRSDPAIISETHITIFCEAPLILRGPRRTMMYLQQTQVSPAEYLEEELMEIDSSPEPSIPALFAGRHEPAPPLYLAAAAAAPSPEDEVDGWVSWMLISSIKTVVFHLLNFTVHSYRRECCYGCQVNHPSRRRHECLETTEDDYLQLHFHRLMGRLFTPRFIPTVQHFLNIRNIQADDARVLAVAETLLHELKTAKKFHVPISEMYDDLIGDDEEKIGQLQMVTELWNRTTC